MTKTWLVNAAMIAAISLTALAAWARWHRDEVAAARGMKFA